MLPAMLRRLPADIAMTGAAMDISADQAGNWAAK